jgi:uncharacterized membrane protein YesL
MHFLDYDSKFMQGLGVVTAGVWISLLMLVTSLPVITIGAAVTAGHDVCRQVLDSRGSGITKAYFHSFAGNFAKATLIWCVFLPFAAALLWSWLAVFDTIALIPKIAFSLIWVMCFEWAFYLQSRFDNPVGRTLRNTVIFSVAHIGATLAVIAVDVVYGVLVWASIKYFPQGLFLLVVLGYGNLLLIHVPILELAMRSQIADPRNNGQGQDQRKPQRQDQSKLPEQDQA